MRRDVLGGGSAVGNIRKGPLNGALAEVVAGARHCDQLKSRGANNRGQSRGY